MSISRDYYDCLFISFSKISIDARAQNILNEIANTGLSALIISFEDDFEIAGNHKFIPIRLEEKRHWKQWLEFTRQVKKIGNKHSIKYIWAADLYSLAPAFYLKQNSEKLFYDSREIYSALGPLSGKIIKQTVITSTEKYFIRKVDEFIVSGEMDAKYLSRHFKTQKDFHVIMNLPPYKEPVDSNIIRETYNLSDKQRIVLYQGAILKGRGIEKAIGMVNELDNSILCILGSGPL